MRVTTNLTYQAILGTIEIGVTGRSEIQQLLSRALEPRLLSVLMAQAVTDDILMAIRQAGYRDRARGAHKRDAR